LILHEVLHELRSKKKQGIILKLDFKKDYGKVSWSFLGEFLERKNFPAKWNRWIMSAVSGGRVAINLNGERGDYFRSYKGLRQGDVESC
jgi:hypothetical protein